jgi:hypothetical protein
MAARTDDGKGEIALDIAGEEVAAEVSAYRGLGLKIPARDRVSM